MNDTRAFVDELLAAVQAHDVDRLVDCFADDYVNETPAHPQRSFHGRGQVRQNWTTIFAAVPDFTADVLQVAVANSSAWTEWEMRGKRSDNSAFLMRGVIIFEVADRRASRARFYLEPVETASGDVNAAIRNQISGTTT